MFIPRSWRNLTGWKAVLAAIVIVGLIGLRVWSRMPRHREVAVQKATIAAGEGWGWQFKASASRTAKIDVSSDSDVEYVVYVFDRATEEEFAAMMRSGTIDADSVHILAERLGKGNVSISGLELEQGAYLLYVENLGERELQCQVSLSEFR